MRIGFLCHFRTMKKGDHMRKTTFRRTITIGIAVFLILATIYLLGTANRPPQTASLSTTTRVPGQTMASQVKTGSIREIYLAGGCFWGVEEYMSRIDGVVDAVSGYANGNTENPKYEDLLYRNSGHAETVQVLYDTSKISLDEVLIYYFNIIDPTSLNKQGNTERKPLTPISTTIITRKEFMSIS